VSIALLATKLFIPPPGSRLVERTRLVNQLDEGLRPGCPLTLVSAPAGFGKTMLASSWIRTAQSSHSNLAVAWASLDEQDNDSNRFWSYLVAAFQTFDKQFGKDAQLLLSSGQTNNTEPVLTILINELARTSAPILLVLDDFHFIEQEVILDALAFLLEHIPPNVHVMILTRSDPHLPLARLRSRNQLLEIRLADLRFSLDEASALLNSSMGLDLDIGPIETLQTKTEGWAAGLQMAGLALQRLATEPPQTGNAAGALKRLENIEDFVASFSGSNRFILDYLLEEVLRRQPVEIQTFLLKTSILDRFCAGLCDAIIENRAVGGVNLPTTIIESCRSQTTLEYLERENLFLMPLDAERCWYRYHQLFADLLKKRLRQIHLSEEWNLHARASQWYEENQLSHPAIEQAFQAPDYARAGRLLDEAGEDILKHGEYQRLLQWIQRLPKEQIQTHWKLYLYKATILASVGQLNQAEECLEDFKKSKTADQLDDWQSGQAATVEALIAIFRGDAAAARRFTKAALGTIPSGSESPWRAHLLIALSHTNQVDGYFEEARLNLVDAIEAGKLAGDIYMTLDATTHLVMMLCSMGQLKQADQFAQQGLQYIEQFGLSRTVEASILYLGWGFILCEQHKLEEAGEYIQQGFEASRKANIPGMMGWAYQVNMRYLMAKSDWPAAEEAAREADRLAKEVEIPVWIESGSSALRSQIWVLQGKISEAEQHLRERGIIPNGDIKTIEHLEYAVLGSLLLKKGELDSAELLIGRLLQRSEAKGQQRLMILNLIQLALLYQAKNDQQLAVQTLERALELAESDGYIQLFLDEGEALSGLLDITASQGRHTAFAGIITGRSGPQKMPAFEKIAEPDEPQTKPAGTLSSLSPREIEVLRLMAEGLSNKEIAQRLYISLRTVKYHATNIFTKLNVSSRTQAVKTVRWI
jgi:LuxR family transcriptional regulator, maltose regulon positive regulatory protein